MAGYDDGRKIAYTINVHNNSSSAEERRRSRRYNLRLPVQLKIADAVGSVSGVTTDISNTAAFVCLPEANDSDNSATVEWVLKVPPELSLTPVQILCKGRVVRVDQGQTGVVGMAISIDTYRFVRATAAGDSN